MEAAFTTKKFTLDEYHQMVDAGILSEEDRVELIYGDIIEMSPLGDNHTKTVRRINKLLNTKLPEYIIDQQNPIKIAGHSEPEPDLVILPFRDDFYPNGVTPSDVLLLIEVSDTTLKYDMTVKLPLYAEAGIPEVWIVDVNKNTIQVNRHLKNGEYQERIILDHMAEINASQLKLAIKVKDLIG